MRFTPRPRTGLVVFLVYLVFFYGTWIINGIDYKHIGDSANTILRWYVVPLAVGAMFLIVAVSVLGWWRPVLFEREKAQPRWLIVGPIVMAVFAAITLLSKSYTSTTGTMFWLLVIGSVGVGFCEEVATRGVLLTGLRGGGYTEPKVWLLSTLAFGLLHLPNWAFGVGPAAVVQVVLAFLSGSMLYLTRRVTGTLIWAILLHGFWDFAGFIGTGGNVAFLGVVNGALALVLVLILVRRERGRHIPATVPGRGAAVPSR